MILIFLQTSGQIFVVGCMMSTLVAVLTGVLKEAAVACTSLTGTRRMKTKYDNLESVMHYRHVLPKNLWKQMVVSLGCISVFVFDHPGTNMLSWDIGWWLGSYFLLLSLMSMVSTWWYMRRTA
ncbi:MAG TPA: hypothetical protein VNG90_03320 [Candidatus Acidoferrum sp.]|nr:hypothetical protein [Candidatus Acidoferrum sp.]